MASDLARATGLVDAAAAASNRLNKIVQLTGFSDPIYAEAYVTGACVRVLPLLLLPLQGLFLSTSICCMHRAASVLASLSCVTLSWPMLQYMVLCA